MKSNIQTIPELRNYLYYEERARMHHPYNRRCIDGNITGCGKCVGYCEYINHSGFLTEKLRKKYECIEKGCFHYLPKIKKEGIRKVLKEHQDENRELILGIINGCEGMKATKLVKDADGGILIKYISITNGYSIPDIENRLSTLLKVPVEMQKVECDFMRAAEIVFS